MSQAMCGQRLCDNSGICEGFYWETVCICDEHYEQSTNCSSCVKGYEKKGI